MAEDLVGVSSLDADQPHALKGRTIAVSRSKNPSGLKLGRRVRGAFSGIAGREARGPRAAKRVRGSASPYGVEPVVKAATDLDGFVAQVGAGDHGLAVFVGVGLAIGVKNEADVVETVGTLRYAFLPPAGPAKAIGVYNLRLPGSFIQDPGAGH